MKKNWLRYLIIAAIGMFFLCCISVVLFVNWSNQPENVAADLAARTAEAFQNATQTAQAVQNAAAATQEMQQITARLEKARPVFTETFDNNSAFLKQNIGDLSFSMSDGYPDIDVPFNADHIWPVGKELGDFVAEVDCEPAGEGAFCGIAYGLHSKDGNPNGIFSASFTGSGGRCGFADSTGNFSTTKDWDCAAPQSPAAGTLNRLRVERFGQHLRFYVNGQLMDDRVVTSQETSGGGVGLYFGRASTNNSGVFHVMVDNFKVWELP